MPDLYHSAISFVAGHRVQSVGVEEDDVGNDALVGRLNTVEYATPGIVCIRLRGFA